MLTDSPLHTDPNRIGSPQTLILASSSPARKKLLEDAGIDFTIIVSKVNEDQALKDAQKHAYISGLGDITPAQTALLLAKAKAQAVAELPDAQGKLVLGCDSVFELEGVAYGKPLTVQTATERIRTMSGRSGTLHTGHWLIDNRNPNKTQAASELRSAVVHFDSLSDEEIAAYVATEEPLWVAGSFTIDGFGAAFIRHIEGEYHTVVGLSINALRSMLKELNYPIYDFWTKNP